MILITGDKGFVGKHLTKEISGIGYDLVDGFDLRDKYQLETVIQNNHIDIVIHLGALAGVYKSNLFPDDYIDTNIKGTINLIESCKRNNVKHLIFFSSSSVYGNGTPPNKETDIPKPISVYGITKLAGELLVQSSGVPYTIIRPFSLYGEMGRKDQIFYKWLGLIKQGKSIQLFGDGTAKRGFTYVGDLVEAVKLILEKGATNEVYNVGGEELVSMNDILNVLKEKYNFNIEILPENKSDIKQSQADISKIKSLGYKQKSVFIEKLKEII